MNSINSSELVHVWILEILFSHSSLSFVSCSLPSNLIKAGGEALAGKRKTTNKQQNAERSLAMLQRQLLLQMFHRLRA